MRYLIRVTAFAVVCSAFVTAQEPGAESIMARVGAYAAAYGEKSSLVVAVETYTQNVTLEGVADALRSTRLIAEFAIVKVEGGGWTGFRDVIEVNGKPVRERRDRLVALFTSPSATINEAARIANESARFNVGPISRNFNTPTAALFFFLPQNLDRFAFTRKGPKTIDGVRTVEIAFKEKRTPTLIMTRAGRDVPLEGALWVNPDDGTVVRTRISMERFADGTAAPEQTAPSQRPVDNPRSNNGGREGLAGAAGMQAIEPRPIDSSASIEVTYRKPPGIDLWLPAEMVELYEGPITIRVRPATGRAITRAKYSDFKQFGAIGKIIPQ
jgi:hypothetical protein